MQVIYAQCARNRKDKYRISTSILEDGNRRVVQKSALTQDANAHIATIADNYAILSSEYGQNHVAASVLQSKGILQMEYIQGNSLMNLMMDSFSNGDYEGFIEWFVFYYQNILRGEDSVSEDVQYTDSEDPNRKFNIDLSFDNIIIQSDGNFVIIDYEWLFKDVSQEFVLWRALHGLYNRCQVEFEKAEMSLENLLLGAGIEKDMILRDRLARCDSSFYNEVADLYLNNYTKVHQIVSFS